MWNSWKTGYYKATIMQLYFDCRTMLKIMWLQFVGCDLGFGCILKNNVCNISEIDAHIEILMLLFFCLLFSIYCFVGGSLEFTGTYHKIEFTLKWIYFSSRNITVSVKLEMTLKLVLKEALLREAPYVMW